MLLLVDGKKSSKYLVQARDLPPTKWLFRLFCQKQINHGKEIYNRSVRRGNVCCRVFPFTD